MSDGAQQVVEAEVTIVNPQGLHARPAHLVVVTANQFPCTISVCRDDLEVDAKSIMSLMMLAAEKGVRLRVRAEGPQAAEAVRALAALFESGFGES